jgi:hypothetical protein
MDFYLQHETQPKDKGICRFLHEDSLQVDDVNKPAATC